MSDTIDRLNAALEGRYRIESDLGEGGMATVYLADDVKHERKVALKVLKPELAAVVGAERFLAEIKTTANLQHPHILPLFDSGQADSFLFYVMPYIEGETLRERIDHDKQLPVDEAVGIAVAVAEALHAAHEAGVVHRDIKPGNILMSRGQPLVADFGIALAVGTAGGNRLTETGLSVGTPYYMSPEQATGDQAIGAASDIYALAAVLYELLTGDPPYVGSTAQAVLGKILQGEPVSATAVRKSIPLNVDAAVRKALEKLPADRFRTASEFARALGDPTFRHGATGAGSASAEAGPWKAVALVATSIALLSVGVTVWSGGRAPEAPPLSVERFETPFRTGQEPIFFGPGAFALSQDGSTLVYRGAPEEGPLPQLWVRRWDDIESAPLRGTTPGFDPVISPDGQEVAFSAAGEIQVVPIAGGPTRRIGRGRFPEWFANEMIYAAGDSGAVRFPAAGGPMEQLTRLRPGDGGHAVTGLSPDESRALLWAGGTTSEIHRLDLTTGELEFLTLGAQPRYVDTGHLLYVLDGTLMAAPFDMDDVEIRGPAVALIDAVAAYKVSANGKLFYSTGTSGGAQQELVWVTRSGAATPVEPGWALNTGGSNAGWALSPDGIRIAVREQTDAGLDIWIKEVGGGPRSRLTFDDGEDRKPVWEPDGETVTFLSARGENIDALRKRADGTGSVSLVFDFERPLAEMVWAPDGQLIFRTGGTGGALGGRDILVIRPGIDEVPTELLAAEYDEIAPAISPNGRWLAYTSNETGQHEVFVRPFPDVEAGRWQVSTDGGLSPKWSASGDEIFYVSGNREMMVAAVTTSPAFTVQTRETLFTLTSTTVVSDIAVPYDVAPDGNRLLMARAYRGEEGAELAPPDVMLVLNWFEELKARVPN